MAYAHPGDGDPHVALLESFRAMVDEHHQAAGRRGRERRRPRRDGGHRRGAARRRRGARRQAVLRPLRRADQRRCATPSRRVDKLLLCADRGIPCVYSTSPLAGGTAPITVAGHVAQGTAESLLGLVIHQLRKPGAPFVFGIGPAVLDMAHHAVRLQRARVPHGLRLRRRDGALARPAQLGLRRHHRRPGDRRAGGHGGRRADVPEPGDRLQPEPRHRLSGLRDDRRRWS